MLMSCIVLCVVVLMDVGGVRIGEPCDGLGFEELSCVRKVRIRRWRRAVNSERSWRVVRIIEVLLLSVVVEKDMLEDHSKEVRLYDKRRGKRLSMRYSSFP